MRTRRFLLLVVTGATLFCAAPALAQTACPAGTVAITTATRADATAAGVPTSSACWDPKSTTTGQADGEAKAYLAQHATKSVNVACFNAQFAIDLAALMKAVPGGPPTITSGPRSAADQVKAQASGASQVGACHSYHQYGLAADFNTTNSKTLLWMRINAPQFGLTRIPALSVQTGCSLKGTGFCDPAHIQISGALPPTNQCGVCSASTYTGTQPDTGTPQSGDDDSRYNTPGNIDYLPYTPPVNAPTFSTPLGMLSTPMMSSLPSMAAPTPVTPVATTPTTATTPQQPICTPTFTCTSGTMYYQTSSCTTQVYQVCSNGCNGNSCAAATSTAGVSNAFTSTTNTNTDTNTNVTSNSSDSSSTQPSVSDILTQLTGYTFTAVDVATTASLGFSLNPQTGEVAQLSGTVPVQNGIASQTISSIQPVDSAQTFTSGDLSGTGFNAAPTATLSQSNGFQAVLAGMAPALQRALSILRSL